MTNDIRDSFEAAWEAIYGKDPLWWDPALRFRFNRMLDAEAYLDAAVMLVPEGWEWCVDNWDGPPPTRWCAWGQFPNKGPGDDHYAETPALALLAAIVKAKNDE